MQAMISQLNSDSFLANIASNQDRREILEMLINNAELFERGSIQYHTNLIISDKYLDAIENNDQAFSLIQMCVIKQ